MLRRPVVRRRGIGLLGAAAVAGTAYAVGSSGARKDAQEAEQEQRLAELEAQQAPRYTQAPPQPAGQDDKIERLRQLAELKQAGILTLDEFEREKQKLLAR